MPHGHHYMAGTVIYTKCHITIGIVAISACMDHIHTSVTTVVQRNAVQRYEYWSTIVYMSPFVRLKMEMKQYKF